MIHNKYKISDDGVILYFYFKSILFINKWNNRYYLLITIQVICQKYLIFSFLFYL